MREPFFMFFQGNDKKRFWFPPFLTFSINLTKMIMSFTVQTSTATGFVGFCRAYRKVLFSINWMWIKNKKPLRQKRFALKFYSQYITIFNWNRFGSFTLRFVSPFSWDLFRLDRSWVSFLIHSLFGEIIVKTSLWHIEL